MARVPYLEAEDLEPEFRDLLKRPINFYKAMVNSPRARRAAAPIGHYIRWESKLDGRLRELAILQVGYIARSAYEWSHHIKIAHEFGVSDDDIRGLIDASEGRPAPGLDEMTATVLKAAREITLDGGMSDATWDWLAARMEREHLVDLALAACHYNSVVRLLATLGVDVEPEYQAYLEKFPLPAKGTTEAARR